MDQAAGEGRAPGAGEPEGHPQPDDPNNNQNNPDNVDDPVVGAADAVIEGLAKKYANAFVDLPLTDEQDDQEDEEQGDGVNTPPIDDPGTETESDEDDMSALKDTKTGKISTEAIPDNTGMDRVVQAMQGYWKSDDIPVHRVRGDSKQMERLTKNTREATKTLRDRLKEENKKFDGNI